MLSAAVEDAQPCLLAELLVHIAQPARQVVALLRVHRGEVSGGRGLWLDRPVHLVEQVRGDDAETLPARRQRVRQRIGQFGLLDANDADLAVAADRGDDRLLDGYACIGRNHDACTEHAQGSAPIHRNVMVAEGDPDLMLYRQEGRVTDDPAFPVPGHHDVRHGGASAAVQFEQQPVRVLDDARGRARQLGENGQFVAQFAQGFHLVDDACPDHGCALANGPCRLERPRMNMRPGGPRRLAIEPIRRKSSSFQ